MRFERTNILGCPVDCASFEEVVTDLLSRLAERRVTHVVFANVAKVVRMRRDEVLADAMCRADLVLADGVPLTWVAPLVGRPLRGRVNGTDLFERMVAEAATHGFGVFFLGATEEVLQAAVAELVGRHPGLTIAGMRNGYFTDAGESGVIDEIAASGADILFIGMSTPKKELWVARNLPRLNVSVCQGVGGSFDVVAGTVKRAPRWMRRSGLEWLYRLCQEPGRMWKRYLVTNTVFLWQLVVELVRVRLFGRPVEKPAWRDVDGRDRSREHRHAA